MATAREGTPGKFFDGDPLIGFMFKVSWGAGTGVTSVGVAGPDDPQVELASAYFTELSGLQDESEVITHKSIGPNGKEVTQKLPGRDDGGEITLKRGVTRGQDFWKWRQQVTAGDIQGARRNIQITLFDRAYNEVMEFEYKNVWPSSISVTGIESSSDSYLIEEITLQHEGFNFDFPWTDPKKNNAAPPADPNVAG